MSAAEFCWINKMEHAMSKDNSEPAFPAPEASMEHCGKADGYTGMTLRDYFAAKCDIAVYAPVDSLYRKHGRNPTVNELAAWIAEVRFIEADAMLVARSA
jgi:hypothetical protein